MLWVQMPVTSQNVQCGFSKPFDVQVAGIKLNRKILQNSKHEQFKMSSEMCQLIYYDMMHIGMSHECRRKL